MNSEKVKVIKEYLKCVSGEKACNDCGLNEIARNQDTFCINLIGEMALDLINELEGENERLLEQRNKTYNIWVKDTEKLKNRITEMEIKNEKRKKRDNDIKRLRKKYREALIQNEFWKSVFYATNKNEYRKKFNDEWRNEYQKELDKQGNGVIAGYPDSDLVYKFYFEQKDRITELEKVYDRQVRIINDLNIEVVKEQKKLPKFAERLKEYIEHQHGNYGDLSYGECEHIIDETLKEFIDE